MRTLLVVLFTVCLTNAFGLCGPEEFHPFEGPAPLAVFIQTDPWAMVIGSDTPRVAIYENGEVVFTKQGEHGLLHRHVILDVEGLAAVKERLQPVLALKDLRRRYDVTRGTTDQPEAQFYLHVGDREVTTTVYGLTARDMKPAPHAESASEVNPAVPPAELLELHAWLCAFDVKESTELAPPYVEVMLWDYSYAPDASIALPKEWPSLDSERAQKRGDSWSIFLDGALEPQLRAFLATMNEKGAVEIEGKKMAVSYRLTFPGEPIWRAAFAGGANPPAKA